MNKNTERLANEIAIIISELKQEVANTMHKDDLRAEYEGYVGVYYTDDFYDMEFYNFEVYKNNKILIHATLARPLTQSELNEKLKNYVNKKKEDGMQNE